MRKLLLQMAFLLLFISGYTQTVNDVLSNGINVRQNDKIYLQQIGTMLQYNLKSTTNFKPLPDSSIFLIHRSGVNIHLQALNPLKYSYDTATTVIADPISVAEEEAFKTIFSRLESIVPKSSTINERVKAGNTQKKNKKDKSPKVTQDVLLCPSIDLISADIKSISDSLEMDMKKGINATFLQLREISFNDKENVKKEVDKIEKDSIRVFRSHYDYIRKQLDKLNKSLSTFSCPRSDSIIIRYVLTQIYKDLKSAYLNKRTRLDNLERAKKLIIDFLAKPEAQPEFAPVWFNDPIYVLAPNKKIVILNVTINQSGMEIKDDEIVTSEKKPLVKRVLRFRKFQRFIPEVSTGIAYLDLAFPKYGTTTNNAGQQVVSSAGEEKFKKMNFTAMVNFVYFSEDWNVNPLIQIGVGENSDFPVLMIGGGFRLNTGLRRISFTVGAASSWIKTLDKLKLNEVVSGTSDIEKDLKYDFKPPKLYFGIQYNF